MPKEQVMRIWVIAVSLLFMSVCRGEDKPINTEQAKRVTLLESFSRGKQITIDSEVYQYLPEVFAVKQLNPSQEPQQALAKIGANLDSLIETKGGFCIFRGIQQPGQAAAAVQVSGVTVYPTVFNKRTGMIGILLGTLAVKPKQMADVAAIASDHGLEVERQFSHLRVVFYKVTKNVDIIDAAMGLRGDARITTASPDILENPMMPN
jgi:hypothetical protein